MLTIKKLQGWGIDFVEGTLHPNLLDIPVTQLKPTISNSILFNKVYKEVINTKDITNFKRTQSNGICIKHLILPSYDLELMKTKTGAFKGVELVVLSGYFMFRLQFTSRPMTTVCGNRAFNKFRQVCRQFNIDLMEYQISKEEGREIKAEIPNPLIKVQYDSFIDREFDNVHHVDFHSSYSGGLKNTYPDFAPVIDYLFEKRHENPLYKEVLNCSIGFMQSQYIGFKFAHLSYAAICDNNKRVQELADRINSTDDRVVLLYNTDGFWYRGPIYHGEGEGEHCGEWQNDHTNCLLRIRSTGSYEYIENGKYYPVVRGLTKLDKFKDREHWEWGDIYRDDCQPLMFTFEEGEGISYEEK